MKIKLNDEKSQLSLEKKQLIGDYIPKLLAVLNDLYKKAQDKTVPLHVLSEVFMVAVATHFEEKDIRPFMQSLEKDIQEFKKGNRHRFWLILDDKGRSY